MDYAFTECYAVLSTAVKRVLRNVKLLLSADTQL